jgi:uncharacterized protein (TIGR03435 family)
MRLAILAALLPMTLLAQQPGATFEVASVRRSAPGTQGGVDVTPGRFTATGVTLRELVKLAYPDGERLRHDNQIAGGPAWIDSDRFDVIATGAPTAARSTAGAVTPPESAEVDTLRAMLRAMLRDRFEMAAHSEQRPLPIYALARVRSDRLGPQLRPLESNCTPGPPRDAQSAACGGFRFVGRERLVAHGVTIAMVVSLLTNLPDAGRIIQDRTGLSGAFDLDLTWNRGGSPESTHPSLFTAVQEQLGLRLEPAQGPVDVLVIDRVAPPRPN